MSMHSREQAQEFLRQLGLLRRRRVLEGTERDQTMTMLRLIGPGEQSNNQRFFSETWQVGHIMYCHTTGQDIDELEEIIDDDL
jgi:hypothetical protein